MEPTELKTVGYRNSHRLANLRQFLETIASNPNHPQQAAAIKALIDFAPQLGGKA
jgi:hypothetical protein